ncbi:MAG TPA: HD domain-containing protein [Acidimicrobiia bacterium]|jgi:dGTPase
MGEPELRRRDRIGREQLEAELLSPAASLSAKSRGRAVPEEPDPYRTAFERDRDRIIHTKAFRRLKHKTQVFINPEGDHFVTRLTHTLHVTQIGRAVAAALSLNEQLTEAICLGHDVGHSPFGHTGEEALGPFVPGGWWHSDHSVRVLSVLEPQNLSWEVLDGIRAHPWRVEDGPATQEGWICRYADRIGYLTHDVADALRAGIIGFGDLPEMAREVLGAASREWIDTMITGVIEASLSAGSVTVDVRIGEAMDAVRRFMFDRVYLRPEAEDQRQRAVTVLHDLVEHFRANPGEIPPSMQALDPDPTVRAVDYVAGMTDRFALMTHDRLYRPQLFD